MAGGIEPTSFGPKEILTAVGILVGLVWNAVNSFLHWRLSERLRTYDVAAEQFRASVEGPLRQKTEKLADIRERVRAVASLADQDSRRDQLRDLNKECALVLTQLKGLCQRLNRDNSVCRAADWDALVEQNEDPILIGFDIALNENNSPERVASAIAKSVDGLNELVVAFNTKIVKELTAIKTGKTVLERASGG